MIRAVLFDLDGVVRHFDHDPHVERRHGAKRYGGEHSSFHRSTIYTEGDAPAAAATLDLLHRDCVNICDWFTRHRVDCDAEALFAELVASSYA